MSVASARLTRLTPEARAAATDHVAVEVPVAFVYNCANHAVMMASPHDLEDLAVGFTLAEGIAGNESEIEALTVLPHTDGITLRLDIAAELAAALASRRRALEGRTSCGLCGVTEIAQALRPLRPLPNGGTVPAEAVERALRALPHLQTANALCGGMHAAALADLAGELMLAREDVGRHTALDKLIGAVARAGASPATGFVVLTSRCSMEMVQKAVTAGVRVLVAVSAPTTLAIQIAERANLTLAAFARGHRLNVYTHPERII
ncbi:MAG: formate dehydrogenase accessory sulfurtransferase FdhD [Ectothiorhodospiraceae bacterium]|nr:formate dehydrogenase accessory sulfurtransferase FdhD [Ectothiorhodospiraceae bacterium]